MLQQLFNSPLKRWLILGVLLVFMLVVIVVGLRVWKVSNLEGALPPAVGATLPVASQTALPQGVNLAPTELPISLPATRDAIAPVPAASPTPPGTPLGILFFDSFDDLPGSLLAGRLPDRAQPDVTWSVGSGLEVFAIDDRGGATLTKNLGEGHITVETNHSDVILTCDVTSGAGGKGTQDRDAGIVFRWSDEGNYWKAGFNKAMGKFRLVQIQNGSAVVQAELDFQPGESPHTLQVSLAADTVRATVDGGYALEYRSHFNQSATRHGITGRQAYADRFDNFTVQAYGVEDAPSNIPEPIDGLVTWFDADVEPSLRQTIGGAVAGVGDPVNEWRDQSGNKNHAHSIYPVLAAELARDDRYRYVKFFGEEDGRGRSALVFQNKTDKDSWTLFLVMRLDPVTVNPNPKIIRLSGNLKDRWELTYMRDNLFRMANNVHSNPAPPGAVNETRTQLIQDDSTWHLVTVVFDSQTGHMILRVDGAQVGKEIPITSWGDAEYDALLGSKEPGGADACPVGLHEVRIYSPALPLEEIERIEHEMWP